MALRMTMFNVVAALTLTAGVASAQCGDGQSPADAWWTGPMLANSAGTLPRGHVLLEPYLYDVTPHGYYDREGVRHGTPHANGFGTLTYAIYGVTDRLGVGLIPTAGFNTISGGPSSSGVGLGDAGLLAQYRLTAMNPCRRLPTISVAIQETFPTGRYDRLDNRPSDGFGSGAYTTTASIYSQKYLWLPNGRILRMRLNFSQSFSHAVDVEGVSVYGTSAGFRGRATPGSSSFVNGAWEYSLTRRWVLALDATYRHARSTRATGLDRLNDDAGVALDSGASHAFGLAPAIEYNWTPNLGVLLGVRVIAAGRNAGATVTPAIAINFVH
jgi:hypothetical protein